ncbi:MAG TPA: 4Fe-4S dicluster domain-containing protein [Anaerolineales bacterium]|nr:4Fe-4S dicluster domain-containing protein [Anaerolineales bacterium]
MNTMLPLQNGDPLITVRGFLRQLLETGVVEAIFLPLEVDGGATLPALVADPAWLDQADPLTPVMPINSARAVSALTNKHSPARLGVVLRPCEIRALIELVKLQQATLENVTLIGLDCPGTYEVAEYIEGKHAGRITLADYLEVAGDDRQPALVGPSLRPACQMCDQPVPEHVDIHLRLFGLGTDQAIPVTLSDEIAEKLGLSQVSQPAADGRQAVVDRLTAARRQVREKELAAIRERLDADGGLASLFATCIRCHNCMTVCPICYCKTCLFKTAAFDHPPEHYLIAARRRGAVRMLGDTLLFQLTRLNHMSASCVSCGMCTSACPADIPVGAIFSAVGAQVQAAFDYQPGRDVSDPLPLITFQANEWTQIGEEK